MCCLFTWMAWCFDASHRLVVFIMACLISSSVCCLLLTASLAGVAMGYNYSLAEYIDLKETNISVYIKRGVYDDEISDDFDWRRAGGGEPSIQLKDPLGLRTSAPDGQQPLAAGRRRSDNSVFESDDQNKYEGGLMRLTSTQGGVVRRFEPPEPPYTTSTRSTPNLVDGLLQVADSLPGGSKERLKALQAAARHHEAKQIELGTAKVPEDPLDRIKAIEENAQIHNARRNDQPTTTDKYAKYFSQLAYHPGFPGSGLSARKFMESNARDISETRPPNRFRDAVFKGQLAGWPMSAETSSTTESFFEYEVSYKPTMPTPPTVKPLLVRPLEGDKPKVQWDLKTLPLSASAMRRYEGPKQMADFRKQGRVYNDYEESRGLPLRKKRNEKEDSVKRESFTITPLLSTKYRSERNDLPSGTIHTVTTISDGSLPNHNVGKSAYKPLTNERQPLDRLDDVKNKFSHLAFIELFITPPNKTSNSGDKSEINAVENISTSNKTKKDNGHFKPRKRKKHSKGYEYKKRGNERTKSIWWRISDGAQEQWNRIILYLGKSVTKKMGTTLNSEKSDKSVTNSCGKKQRTFMNKLGTISTNKLMDEYQYSTSETNAKTSLETSTDLDLRLI